MLVHQRVPVMMYLANRSNRWWFLTIARGSPSSIHTHTMFSSLYPPPLRHPYFLPRWLPPRCPACLQQWSRHWHPTGCPSWVYGKALQLGRIQIPIYGTGSKPWYPVVHIAIMSWQLMWFWIFFLHVEWIYINPSPYQIYYSLAKSMLLLLTSPCWLGRSTVFQWASDLKGWGHGQKTGEFAAHTIDCQVISSLQVRFFGEISILRQSHSQFCRLKDCITYLLISFDGNFPYPPALTAKSRVGKKASSISQSWEKTWSCGWMIVLAIYSWEHIVELLE